MLTYLVNQTPSLHGFQKMKQQDKDFFYPSGKGCEGIVQRVLAEQKAGCSQLRGVLIGARLWEVLIIQEFVAKPAESWVHFDLKLLLLDIESQESSCKNVHEDRLMIHG